MASNAKNLAEYLNNQTTSATADIADGSITTAKLADDSVTVAKVGAGAIDATALASNAVTTAKVADGAVTQVKTTSVGKNKNVCINGGMRIAQRSASVSSISSGGAYHTCDRWRTVVDTSGTWTQTQETLAVTDPTADRTLTFPNRSGTVAITSDTAFPQSTLVEHPAASGNHDAGAVTAATTDAFGALIGDLFDNMEPRGSTGTVDLGSVA